MNLWPFHRRIPHVPNEAVQAAADSRLQLETAKYLAARAGVASESMGETIRRNHIAEAVVRSIRGDT